MTLSETFSRTTAVFRELMEWVAGFDWTHDAVSTVGAFNECQLRFQHNGDESLLRFSNLLREADVQIGSTKWPRAS